MMCPSLFAQDIDGESAAAVVSWWVPFDPFSVKQSFRCVDPITAIHTSIHHVTSPHTLQLTAGL